MWGRTIKIVMIWLLLQGWVTCFGQEQEGNSDYQYALIEAVKQKNLGNIAEAVKLYRLVIKDKPDCDVAHYELGTIYLMSNQPDLARQSLEKAYRLDPDNQWFTLGYLNALGATEAYDEIITILKKKMKEDPEEVEWEFQLATVHYSKGKTGKAIRMLERIEKERGFSEKITLQKASIYESEEKYALARQEIEKVMALFPEALQFRIVAAELSLKSGEEEKAADYYREILEIDSTNIFALTNLTDYYRKKEDYSNSFHFLRRSFSNALIDVKRKKAILSYYLSEEEFVNKYGDALDSLVAVFTEMHPEDAEGLLMATDFYIDKRDYGKAFGHLNSFLDQHDGNYPIHMQAILLANAASLNEELIALTDKAIELYPDSADIRFFRGIGLYEEGRYRELITNFEKVSFNDYSMKEYASQSKMLFAEAYYRLEEYIISDSLFENLISEEPGNDLVLNNYSYYLAERGEKLERAERWSRRTIDNNPENATFIDTYAWILYKMGDYEKAEEYIMDALEKGGKNDPEINEHAGDILKALQNYEIAKSYYMKAILLGGEKKKLENKIESIQNELDK
jgi:tetratricopeptide (TPR) repeat protein